MMMIHQLGVRWTVATRRNNMQGVSSWCIKSRARPSSFKNVQTQKAPATSFFYFYFYFLAASTTTTSPSSIILSLLFPFFYSFSQCWLRLFVIERSTVSHPADRYDDDDDDASHSTPRRRNLADCLQFAAVYSLAPRDVVPTFPSYMNEDEEKVTSALDS